MKIRENFIKDANLINFGKYDYSKTKYIDSKTKVIITCPVHGDFSILPQQHLKGYGCVKCRGNDKATPEAYRKKVEEVYGDKYDLSKLKFENCHSDITFGCKIHGEVTVKANTFLRGDGCPKCEDEKKGEKFYKDALEKYGDKYDLSRAKYIDSNTKILVVCKKHGEFLTSPSKCMRFGCPQCLSNKASVDDKLKEYLHEKGIKFEEQYQVIFKDTDLCFRYALYGKDGSITHLIDYKEKDNLKLKRNYSFRNNIDYINRKYASEIFSSLNKSGGHRSIEDIDYDEFYDAYVTRKLSNEEVANELGLEYTMVKKYVDKMGLKGHTKEDINSIRSRRNLQKYGVENPSMLLCVREKVKETFLNNYGVDHPLKSDAVKKKVQNTNMEVYGVKHVFQSEEIKDKIKQNNLLRYGVEYNGQRPDVILKSKISWGIKDKDEIQEILNKRKETSLSIYGVEYPIQSKEVKDKVRQVNLDKYGCDNVFQSEDIKDKIRQTNFERLGVEYSMQSEEVKEKYRNTNKERYGVEYPTQRHRTPEQIEATSSKEKLRNYILTHYEEKPSLHKLAKDLSLTYIPSIVYKFGLNGLVDLATTGPEQLLLDKFPTNEVHRRNILGGLELDLYYPDKKFAIEYNSTYWHRNLGKNYHLNKTLLCKEKGIRLFHIFEKNWKSNFGPIMSFLENVFSKPYEIKNPIIKKIGPNKFSNFCERYSITPYYLSEYRYGLYDEDTLVSVMGFYKNKKGEFLLTYCSKKRLIGGFRTLLNAFTENKSGFTIKAKCDNALFTGKTLERNGFKLIKNNSPKLVDSIIRDDKEIEVYDCGNSIYKLDI